MTNQFTEVLQAIKDFERRLSNLESSNQVRRISNASGDIIDEDGLVSTNSFKRAQIFNGGSGDSTSSTSFVDVTGSSLAPFTLSRTTNVLVYMMSYGYNNTAITSELQNNMEVQVHDSSINDGRTNTVTYGSSTTNLWVDDEGYLNWSEITGCQMAYNCAVLEFEAGTHTLKLQLRAFNGGTAVLASWLIGYIILGT